MTTSQLYLTEHEWEQYAQTTEQWGTVRWFGPDWHAPINKAETRIEPPIGVICYMCGQLVEEQQRGVAIPAMTKKYLTVYHHGCFMQTILGPGWQGLMESAGADPGDFD